MKATLLSLHAGQTGKLIFNITAPEGADTALNGALAVKGKAVPMDTSVPGRVYIPPVAVGCWPYEIRCGGVTVLHGELDVAPSPLGNMGGEVVWQVDADLNQPLAVVNIIQNPGPAGRDGRDGKSAYELWLDAGHVGSLDDFLNSLQGTTGQDGAPGKDGEAPTAEDVAAALLPMISAELAYEGPAAANNWHANYFMLGENYLPQGTALVELGYRVRFDSLSGCTTDPVYLGVWERAETGDDWEPRGVSLNTQVQALSTDMLWQFDPAAVRLSGRPIRCCLMATREDGWRTDLTMGLRVTDTTAANTAIVYNDQTWQKIPKYFLRGYKPVDLSGGPYAPASHVSDTTAHLTAEEHSKLTTLLQNGSNSGGSNSGGGNSGDGNFEDTGHILGGTAEDSTCTATGSGAQASVYRSTATGFGAQASSSYATATGSGAIASSPSSTATGQCAEASGIYATATGYYAFASGFCSTATGPSAKAYGTSSTATGTAAIASGSHSTATGASAQANGDYSTASGYKALAEKGEHVLRAGDRENYTSLKIASPYSEVSKSMLDNESGLGFSENGRDWRYIKLAALFDLVESGGSGGGGAIEVTQTYDPASDAALSGKAVAEALQQFRQTLAGEGLIATTREIEALNTPAGYVFRINNISRVYLSLTGTNNSTITKNGGLLVAGVKLLVMAGLWNMRVDDPQSWSPIMSVSKTAASSLSKSLEQTTPDYPVEEGLYVTGKIVDIQEMWDDYWVLEISFDKPIIVSTSEYLTLGASDPFSMESCITMNAFCYTSDRKLQRMGMYYTFIVRE